MPIVGCVVFTKPEKGKEIEEKLKNMKNVDVYAAEYKEKFGAYLIVVVLEGETFEEVEAIEKQINSLDGVMHVGVGEAYFLDEFEKIQKGEIYPTNPFGPIPKLSITEDLNEENKKENKEH